MHDPVDSDMKAFLYLYISDGLRKIDADKLKVL